MNFLSFISLLQLDLYVSLQLNAQGEVDFEVREREQQHHICVPPSNTKRGFSMETERKKGKIFA